MRYVTTIGKQEFLIDIIDEKHLALNGQVYQIDFDVICDQPVYSLLINEKSYEAYVYPVENAWQVLLHGRLYQAVVEDEAERRLRTASAGAVSEHEEFKLEAPMPGLVVAVPVTEGQEIKKGEVLVILESMKMQNELRSPRDGSVSRLRVKAGDNVEQHQTMLSVV